MNYNEAISFIEKSKKWVNPDGTVKEWKYNYTLCQMARKFLGNYNWEGTVSFKKAVFREIGYRKYFWNDTLHNLGETEGEIFQFFYNRINSDTYFNFPDGSTLLEFWVETFREQLEALDDKWVKKTDEDLALALYWAVANTVPGLLAEVEAKAGLEELFKDDEDVRVEWAPDELDYEDIDLIIFKGEEVWHRVSVKNGRAFSRDCIIKKYREGWGKKAPSVYIDGSLNRVFIKGDSVWYTVLENGDEDYLESIKEDWNGSSDC